MKIDSVHAWALRVTMPKDGKTSYRRNEVITVVARSMTAAIAEAECAFPGIDIWAINHMGERTVLIATPELPTHG